MSNFVYNSLLYSKLYRPKIYKKGKISSTAANYNFKLKVNVSFCLGLMDYLLHQNQPPQ